MAIVSEKGEGVGQKSYQRFANQGSGPMLLVYFLDGSAKAFPYAHVVEIDFQCATDCRITLDFGDRKLILAGRSLQEILPDIALHRLEIVRVTDPLVAAASKSPAVLSATIASSKKK